MTSLKLNDLNNKKMESTNETVFESEKYDPLQTIQSTTACTDVSALRRVLLAYALRNPAIGYCQSMNFITALLLYHLTEENAFWVLASLLEDILPSDYYSSSMVGARVDQQVFLSCIQWKLPRLHEHLKNMNTVLEPVCYPWFLCLYVNTLPIYTVCRIWDCLFHEGNIVLFKVALGMLKCKEEKLLQCNNMMSIYMLLRSDNTANENYVLEQSTATDSATSVHSFLLFESFEIIKSVPRKRLLTYSRTHARTHCKAHYYYFLGLII